MSAGASRIDGRSIGVLGGTFNPPHVGHLALARHARRELGLERVLLVPLHTPPHKPAGEDPGPAHRLRMCRLAVDGVADVEVCALEIERGGPSYTVDTLSALHASHPDAELTLILGADTASTLPAWCEPARLLGLADLAVATRENTSPAAVLDAIAAIPVDDVGQRDGKDRVRFLEMPAIAVSSSTVRHRVAEGEAIEELVGPDVAEYIVEHDLYRVCDEDRR